MRVVVSLLVVGCLIGPSPPASAQEQVGSSPGPATAFGFAFGAPVAVRGMGIREFAFYGGGGGEKLIGPIGIGGEAGYLYTPAIVKSSPGSYASMKAASGFVASALGSYHFPGWGTEPRTAQPFVTGGMGIMVGTGEAWWLWNYGGGLDWWLGRHGGLHFKVQDQLGLGVVFQGGVVFR